MNFIVVKMILDLFFLYILNNHSYTIKLKNGGFIFLFLKKTFNVEHLFISYLVMIYDIILILYKLIHYILLFTS